jgi:hypothetical protein
MVLWVLLRSPKPKISFEEGEGQPQKPGTLSIRCLFSVCLVVVGVRGRKNHAWGGLGTDGDGVSRFETFERKKKTLFLIFFGGSSIFHFQFLKLLSFLFSFFLYKMEVIRARA